MNNVGPDFAGDEQPEDLLRAELARGRRALAAVPMVISALIDDALPALFSEEVVARTRGMMDSLALQLVRGCTGEEPEEADLASLTADLTGMEPLLTHCHALALEGNLLVRLGAQGLDPVLSPILQQAISGVDPDLATLAMQVLAAQGRFLQAWRRMELPLAELPAELFDQANDACVTQLGARRMPAGSSDREGSEQQTRSEQIASLLLSGSEGLTEGLDPERAGVSLFVSAASLSTGIARSTVIQTIVGGQEARLALMLGACGVDSAARLAAISRLSPDAVRPVSAIGLSPQRARALLAEERAG